MKVFKLGISLDYEFKVLASFLSKFISLAIIKSGYDFLVLKNEAIDSVSSP